MSRATPVDEVTSLLRSATASITTDPIIIGYNASGELEIVTLPDLDIEKAFFMLHQAAAVVMEMSEEETEDAE